MKSHERVYNDISRSTSTGQPGSFVSKLANY